MGIEIVRAVNLAPKKYCRLDVFVIEALTFVRATERSNHTSFQIIAEQFFENQ